MIEFKKIDWNIFPIIYYFHLIINNFLIKSLEFLTRKLDYMKLISINNKKKHFL